MANNRVKLTGDWGRVGKILSMLPKSISNNMESEVRRQADFILEQIKLRIEEQSLSIERLSPDYLSAKIRSGLDRRTLIATGEYISKLRVEVRGSGYKTQIFIGAFDSDIHESSGLSMGQLGEWLEEGTSRMPARPHVRPVWEDVKGQVREALASRLKELIRW